MLVLSRKLDESIKIGNDIKITILRVKGNTIRIGIDAPSEVRVIRSELQAHDQVASAEEGSSTVTAIVDSPALASNRVFVGKITGQNIDLALHSQLGEDIAMQSNARGATERDDQAAPLRAFLRGSRGLTAV